MVFNGTSMGGARSPAPIGLRAPPASPMLHPLSAAMPLVVEALVQSYPSWTDEHGTNVDQLAAIAVAALYEQGLLVAPEPAAEPIRPSATQS